MLPQKVRRAGVRVTQASFTVSASAIVFDDEGRVLLLEHVLRPGCGWDFGGGYLNAGENAKDAVSRELFEEAGITIRNLELVHLATHGHHVELIFRARHASGEVRPSSREILDARWFAIDELPECVCSGRRELIAKAAKLNKDQ